MTTISSTASGASYYASQRSPFSKLDTDQDGKLSSEEFVAGRPKGVSEAQASSLYAKIDSNGTDALTEDQLQQGMEQGKKHQRPEDLLSADAMSVLMLMSPQNGNFGGATAADMYADMDADDDGSVSQAEFLAARPGDVSEEDAKALYDSIDTEGTGSITEEQFAESMKAQGGPPKGGAGPGGATSNDDEESEESFDSLDTNQDGVVSADELLAVFPDGLDGLSFNKGNSGIDEILSMLSGDGATEAA